MLPPPGNSEGEEMKSRRALLVSLFVCAALMSWLFTGLLWASDLPEIRKKGVLRHLGIRYANFVTGSGDGLDVEMVKLFAAHLGVKYQFVETSWDSIFEDLIGAKVKVLGDEVEILGDKPVKGDIAACGLTVIPWRQKLVSFSDPTFPTQVWLVARAQSPLQPIRPSGDTAKDIAEVQARVRGMSILGIPHTCLDPELYKLVEAGVRVKAFGGKVSEMVPAAIAGEADGVLQDAPGALLAVEKWAGKIKIIGPVSSMQSMAYAFPKSSPELLDAFNRFFQQCKADGTYTRLVNKYYPTVFKHYPEFFFYR